MKARFRVGCVPYVNARPLVACFDQPNEFVEVVYDVPSRLPALLDSGEVDAILVSSIEYLRRQDLACISEVGIMSNGPVASVRMLSKVPLEEIKTLALDESSMTSNMLAQIILAERGVRPTLVTMAPDQAAMLAKCDACVLIGDKGLEADGTGLVDVDLGEAWTELTGEPFVWALWLAREDRFAVNEWGVTEDGRTESQLSETLTAGFQASGFQYLHSALDYRATNGEGLESSPPRRNKLRSLEHISRVMEDRRQYVIASAMERSGWSEERVADYLTRNVRYSLDFAWHGEAKPNPVKLFNRYLVKNGLFETFRSEMRTLDLRRMAARIERVRNLIPSSISHADAERSEHPEPVEY